MTSSSKCWTPHILSYPCESPYKDLLIPPSLRRSENLRLGGCNETLEVKAAELAECATAASSLLSDALLRTLSFVISEHWR